MTFWSSVREAALQPLETVISTSAKGTGMSFEANVIAIFLLYLQVPNTLPVELVELELDVTVFRST